MARRRSLVVGAVLAIAVIGVLSVLWEIDRRYGYSWNDARWRHIRLQCLPSGACRMYVEIVNAAPYTREIRFQGDFSALWGGCGDKNPVAWQSATGTVQPGAAGWFVAEVQLPPPLRRCLLTKVSNTVEWQVRGNVQQPWWSAPRVSRTFWELYPQPRFLAELRHPRLALVTARMVMDMRPGTPAAGEKIQEVW